MPQATPNEAELAHELMDRAHVASEYLQNALGDHPALAARTGLQVHYAEALDRLERIYQELGRELGADDDTQSP